MFSENKREKKNKNNKNYNNSNKTNLEILFNIRRQYLYSRTKPKDISLDIMQLRTSFILIKKNLDCDVRSDRTVRNIIAFAIRWQQNIAVNRHLTSVLNIRNN